MVRPRAIFNRAPCAARAVCASVRHGACARFAARASRSATIIFDFFCSLSRTLPFVSVFVRGKEDEGVGGGRRREGCS